MSTELTVAARILDAAAQLIVRGGFEGLTLTQLADESATSETAIVEEFGGLDQALVIMLNREFAGIYVSIIDHVERDPRGGLLSRIYLYTLSAIYERPLARMLYTVDREAMNTIMRRANSLGYIPGVGIRVDFIENMQSAGMVRRDVDAGMVSHMITIFSAGLALTSPHEDLDLIVRGVTELIARAIDANVDDTSAGKAAFFEWATSL